MQKGIIRNAAIVLAAMLATAGCEERKTGAPATETKEAATTTRGVTADTIKVGSYGPLSGPAAAWGVVLRSMSAYFDHINASGGVHGRKIEFIYRDDQYSPAKTPGVVRELVEKEGVFAIVGGIGTANGRAVADYLEEKNVPFVTPASGDSYFTSPGKKNIYTTYPRYVTEGQILGEYIGRELKSLKVGVLYQDDDFGAQGAEGLEKGLQKFGGKIALRVTCLPTDTDLSGQVGQITANLPEVLVIFTAPKQAVMAVKQLHAMKKKPHVLTSFVLSDPIMFKLAGAEVWEGTITSAATKLATSDDPSVAKYREVLKQYGGDELPVGSFSEAGFAFAMPFVEALERAGRDLTPEKLYAALESMKAWDGGGPHWAAGGLNPPITFSATDRLGSDKIFFARAENGEWKQASEWIELAEDEGAVE